MNGIIATRTRIPRRCQVWRVIVFQTDSFQTWHQRGRIGSGPARPFPCSARVRFRAENENLDGEGRSKFRAGRRNLIRPKTPFGDNRGTTQIPLARSRSSACRIASSSWRQLLGIPGCAHELGVVHGSCDLPLDRFDDPSPNGSSDGFDFDSSPSTSPLLLAGSSPGRRKP